MIIYMYRGMICFKLVKTVKFEKTTYHIEWGYIFNISEYTCFLSSRFLKYLQKCHWKYIPLSPRFKSCSYLFSIFTILSNFHVILFYMCVHTCVRACSDVGVCIIYYSSFTFNIWRTCSSSNNLNTLTIKF